MLACHIILTVHSTHRFAKVAQSHTILLCKDVLLDLIDIVTFTTRPAMMIHVYVYMNSLVASAQTFFVGLFHDSHDRV